MDSRNNVFYELTSSNELGKKRVKVTFYLNGEIKFKIYSVKESKILNYFDEAKKLFEKDNNLNDSTLAISSKPRKKLGVFPILAACLGVTSIVFASLFIWKATSNVTPTPEPQPQPEPVPPTPPVPPVDNTITLTFDAGEGHVISGTTSRTLDMKLLINTKWYDVPHKDTLSVDSEDSIFKGWMVNGVKLEDDYVFSDSATLDPVLAPINFDTFNFGSVGGSSLITLNSDDPNIKVFYKYSTSEEYVEWTSGMTIVLGDGEEINIVGNNPNGFSTNNTTSSFSSDTIEGTSSLYVNGNINALIDGGEINDVDTIPCDYCFDELLSGCANLVDSSHLILPYSNLKKYCYNNMFRGCKRLTKISPILHAQNLTDYCYSGMYAGTGISKAPDIEASSLAFGCCNQMFSGCYILEKPAVFANLDNETRLADSCFYGMYKNCYKLVTPPELNYTNISNTCYASMFEGCASLSKAPALPALRLYRGCYNAMFKGCTSLTEAPYLPATNDSFSLRASQQCYMEMFMNCSNLSKVEVGFNDFAQTESATFNYTTNWLTNTANGGTFKYHGEEKEIARTHYTIPETWTSEAITSDEIEINFIGEGVKYDGAYTKTFKYPKSSTEPLTLELTLDDPLNYYVSIDTIDLFPYPAPHDRVVGSYENNILTVTFNEKTYFDKLDIRVYACWNGDDAESLNEDDIGTIRYINLKPTRTSIFYEPTKDAIYPIRLIGINHDELADGSGTKAHTTWQFARTLNYDYYLYSYNKSNQLFDYINGAMNLALNGTLEDYPVFDEGTIIAQINETISSKIKLVNKTVLLSDLQVPSTYVENPFRAYLFPLSLAEINYDTNYEGTPYDYYLDHDDYDMDFIHCLRSPNTESLTTAQNYGEVFTVGRDNKIYSFKSTNSFSIAPAFCI